MLAAHRFLKPQGAVNQIAYVRRTATNTSFNVNGSSMSFATNVAASAGDKLIMFVSPYSATGTIRAVTSVTDSAGNTWNVDMNGTSPNNYIGSAFCSVKLTAALPASSTITITFSAALGNGSIVSAVVDEWLFPTAAGVDKTGAAWGYSTSSLAQVSAVTTSAYGLVLSGTNYQQGPGTITGPTGYTRIDDSLWYLRPTTKQQFSAAISWTNTVNYSSCLVAYLP